MRPVCLIETPKCLTQVKQLKANTDDMYVNFGDKKIILIIVGFQIMSDRDIEQLYVF